VSPSHTAQKGGSTCSKLTALCKQPDEEPLLLHALPRPLINSPTHDSISTRYPACPSRHETGSALAYFSSGWSWLELASNGLLAVCISLWWIFVEQLTKKYQVGAGRCGSGSQGAPREPSWHHDGALRWCIAVVRW
jgi:hypothetical protein